MIIGYARTSTVEQKAGYESQLVELRRAGCEKLFSEQVSSVAERVQLAAALDYVRDGDTLVVTKLDRLARSLPHLLELVERLERKGCTLRILNMGVDTGTPTGRLMLSIVGGIAQFEREMMLERQLIGIAKARAEGKYRGQYPKARRQAEAIRRLKAEGVAVDSIAGRLGLHRASVYRVLADGKD